MNEGAARHVASAKVNVDLATKNLYKALEIHSTPNSVHAHELRKIMSDLADIGRKLEGV